MATDVQSGAEPASLSALLGGIVNDIHELFNQQLALLQHQLRKDVQETATAGASCAGGAIVTAAGIVLLGLGLVHLLAWGTDLPLWASFLIFAAVFLLCGGIMIGVGAHKFANFKPLPDETAKALKENVSWITKPK